jgi:cytochrome b561
MLRNTVYCWGTLAKLLHWGMAALILAQIGLGLIAASWRVSPLKLELFFWHKSIGMLIVLFVLIRLLWRACNPTPVLPEGTPGWERIAARSSHLLLYMLMLALPLTGWIVNSASNIPFRIFWLIPLPAIVAPDELTADLFALVHRGLFVMITVILTVHIGAALWHHFVKRNNVLVRMLPGRRSPHE